MHCDSHFVRNGNEKKVKTMISLFARKLVSRKKEEKTNLGSEKESGNRWASRFFTGNPGKRRNYRKKKKKKSRNDYQRSCNCLGVNAITTVQGNDAPARSYRSTGTAASGNSSSAAPSRFSCVNPPPPPLLASLGWQPFFLAPSPPSTIDRSIEFASIFPTFRKRVAYVINVRRMPRQAY